MKNQQIERRIGKMARQDTQIFTIDLAFVRAVLGFTGGMRPELAEHLRQMRKAKRTQRASIEIDIHTKLQTQIELANLFPDPASPENRRLGGDEASMSKEPGVPLGRMHITDPVARRIDQLIVAVNDINIRVGGKKGHNCGKRIGHIEIIGILPSQNSAASKSKTLVNRIRLAAIRLGYPVQLRVAPQDRDGRIAGTTVDDDMLVVAIALLCETANRRFDIVCTVKTGSNDRNGRVMLWQHSNDNSDSTCVLPVEHAKVAHLALEENLRHGGAERDAFPYQLWHGRRH